MEFIELTAYKTGRTFHVRADRVSVVIAYVNDDEGEKYTRVLVGLDADNELHVVETPEEVLRRIRELELLEAEDYERQYSSFSAAFCGEGGAL